MDRLISEQYLIEHLKACFENGRPMYRPTLDEVLEMIKAIPSSDPNITWVTGADEAKVAFLDVPVWKVTKICKILGELQESEVQED